MKDFNKLFALVNDITTSFGDYLITPSKCRVLLRSYSFDLKFQKRCVLFLKTAYLSLENLLVNW